MLTVLCMTVLVYILCVGCCTSHAAASPNLHLTKYRLVTHYMEEIYRVCVNSLMGKRFSYQYKEEKKRWRKKKEDEETGRRRKRMRRRKKNTGKRRKWNEIRGLHTE